MTNYYSGLEAKAAIALVLETWCRESRQGLEVSVIGAHLRQKRLQSRIKSFDLSCKPLAPLDALYVENLSVKDAISPQRRVLTSPNGLPASL